MVGKFKKEYKCTHDKSSVVGHKNQTFIRTLFLFMWRTLILIIIIEICIAQILCEWSNLYVHGAQKG